MKSIFIGSVSDFSGKNLISLGVAKHFAEEKLKVGYIKPIGMSPIDHEKTVTDADVIFFKNVLGLKEPLADICPVIFTPQMISDIYNGDAKDILKKIKETFNRVSKDKDVTLVSGSGNISTGCFAGCSQLDILQELDSKVVMIDKYEHSDQEIVDSFVWMKKIIGDRLIGVVINKVPESKVEFFKMKIVPFLRKAGIETLGIIPEDTILHSVSVKEIVKALNGKVICCEEELGNLVERIVVGAMNVDSALKYFRRINNKAVVTGGDRGDIQLAAMETSTRCLILTGDLHPHHTIVTVAIEKKVPLIVVPYDTLTTIDKFETVLGHLSLHDEKKVDRAIGIVSNCIDFRLIDKFVR